MGRKIKHKKQGKQLGKMSHEIEMENVGIEMEDHSGNDPPPYGMPENKNNQYVL